MQVLAPEPAPGWELRTYEAGRLLCQPAAVAAQAWARPFRLDPHPYALPPDLASAKAAVVAGARRRAPPSPPPFDGACVRLCADLDAGTQAVPLAIVGYFDLLASNYLVPEGDPSPLAQSVLANPIGVSTLLITADGWLVLIVQGAGAGSSPGLVAPSGSGSLEPRDLIGRAGLAEALIAGMERELREENGLLGPPAIGLSTRISGYGRWLEKGSKPEFFGVTRADVTMAELTPRIDRAERAYVDAHILVEPARVALLAAGAISVPDVARAQASLPLEACLEALT